MPQPRKPGDRRDRYNNRSGYESSPERLAKRALWMKGYRMKKKQEKEMQKYFVAWQTSAGFSGRGVSGDLATVTAWVEELNVKYPEIKHWVEKEE
jgi:hypothetical protein